MFNITRSVGDICELNNTLLKKDEKKAPRCKQRKAFSAPGGASAVSRGEYKCINDQYKRKHNTEILYCTTLLRAGVHQLAEA